MNSFLAGYLCTVPADNGWPFVFYTFGKFTLRISFYTQVALDLPRLGITPIVKEHSWKETILPLLITFCNVSSITS